ncbi:hypothetical protein, partial [Escherichia coli]|uniref:hypothetical protein n=1 Tax=Escherichia coli TaxID=562 RepID=UPI0032DAB9D3
MIAPFMCSTLKEAYDRASDHYQVYLDQQEVYDRNKKKTDDKSHKFSADNKKATQESFNPMPGREREGSNWRNRHVCPRCGRNHPGANCQGMRIRCYKCGLLGHKAAECRTRMDNFRDPSQGNNQKGGFGGNAGQKPVETRNGGGNFQQGNWGRP